MAAAPDAENLPFFALRPDVEVEDAASAAEDADSVTAAPEDRPEADSVTEEAEVASATAAAAVLPEAVIKTSMRPVLSFLIRLIT